MTLEPSIFPLFIEDNEISSLVTLINSSGISSSALLTIRDQQGKAYAPVSIPVVAHAKVQIKVADLLQKIGAHVRTGSILVTQGPELTRPSILGQLTLAETTAAPVALTEEELVMPMLFDSQDLHSISESATDAQLIAVTSLSTEPQHITVQCYKKAGVTTKTATLAPGGTALLYPCSKDSSQFEGISLLGASETTESAGISLHSDGPNGGFAAFGLARHISPETKSNFLGSLQFIDPTSLHSSALVFTGVSAGYSLTPGAHPYSAAVALANFSAEQSHITIAFHKTDVNGSVSSTTKDVVLAPQSSTQVPLGQLGLKAGEIGSLIVSTNQQPGDLMAKIVSSSDSAPNQLEQLAKDALSYRNGGAHPWTLQDNARSDIVLFNHSSRIEPFNVLITTEDGAQWIKQLTLAPFETRTISINDLIKNKTPDSQGRTLPATAWSGTAVWHTGGPGIGSGHVLIRSEANSTGENFSCDQVYVMCGAWADASPTTISIGDTGVATAGEDVCVEWGTVGTCGGDYFQTYSQSWGASWTSGDSNVVSVIADTWQATYGGSALGTTYLTGFVSDTWGCYAYVNTPDISVVAPDNTPVLTGIDPSDWPADGIAYQVTFTGQYFGTNQPTLTFSDSTIGYSLLSYNDTQIVAYVTVPSGTPDEDVTVGVTSAGYYGRSGFLSGGGQNSPLSSSIYAAVMSPLNTAEVTIIAWVDQTAPDLARLANGANPDGANSTLVSNLNSSGSSCIGQVGAWIVGFSGNLNSQTDRDYASAWLLLHSANTDPGPSIDPPTQRSGGDYRLYSDWGNGKAAFDVGVTPDPCSVFGASIEGWLAKGEASTWMGFSGTTGSGNRYKVTEGRIGKIGEAVSKVVNNNRSVPWIYDVIEFDPSGIPIYSDVATFPTYSVYVNGQRVSTHTQSSVKDFIGTYDGSNETGWSPIP
jgi:hypothetical protein